MYYKFVLAILLSFAPISNAFTPQEIPSLHVLKTVDGIVASVSGSLITINTVHGKLAVTLSQNAQILGFKRLNVSDLRPGNSVSVVYSQTDVHGESIAQAIYVDIDRWGGIVKVLKTNKLRIMISSDEEGPPGIATITFSPSTIFSEGSFKDLKVGDHVEVVGVVSKRNQMLATRVLSFGPSLRF